jgi:T5SS/PEP-CTERM-associated repeat protein
MTTIALGLSFAASPAFAQTTNWTGGTSSDWFTVSNWSLNAVPNNTNFVNINIVSPNVAVIATPGAQASTMAVGNSGTGTLNVQDGGQLLSGPSYLGLSAGVTGTATVSGANSSWTSTGLFMVGNLGTAVLNIQDGGKVSNTIGYIGFEAGSHSSVTVSGVARLGPIQVNSMSATKAAARLPSKMEARSRGT